MRRGCSNSGFIYDDTTLDFIGISLGYDFTAEHEWGIDNIYSRFGMNKDLIGIERRIIHKHDGVIVSYKGDLGVMIGGSPKTIEILSDKTFDEMVNNELYFDSKKPSADILATAWDDGSFGIVAQKECISKLYDAFQQNDIAITSIKSDLKAFENTALCVVIASKLPKQVIDDMYKTDMKAINLVKYEKEIGMTELKEKVKKTHLNPNGKYWMACSPRWINYQNESPERKEKTQYDIMYWVNYGDDEVYGWFTVEQIRKWLSTPDLKLKSLKVSKLLKQKQF